MADGTKIEWTEATWNPITGCSLASPGCTNCYAMQLAGTRLKHSPSRKGLTQPSKAGPVWTGEVRFNAHELTKPMRWERPRMIFVCAHGDLFHESVPDAWIDRIFAVMALCPQHTFHVLTKRADRMRVYLTRGRHVEIQQQTRGLGLHELDRRERMDSHVQRAALLPLPNVWLGVSVEDQKRADERIPDLLATPAAVRWISAEPLLGPVDLERVYDTPNTYFKATSTKLGQSYNGQRLDWVVAGGESGSKARPMHPDWARSLRDQCADAGVPFFFKQWGSWMPMTYFDGWDDGFDYRFDDGSNRTLGEVHRNAAYDAIGNQEFGDIGKKRAGRLLDGVEHNGMPGK